MAVPHVPFALLFADFVDTELLSGSFVESGGDPVVHGHWIGYSIGIGVR